MTTTTTTVPTAVRDRQHVIHAVQWGYHHQEVVGVVAAIVLGTAFLAKWRIDRWVGLRRGAVNRWKEPVAQILHCDPKVVKKRFEQRRLVSLKLSHPAGAREWAPNAMRDVKAALEYRVGVPVNVVFNRSHGHLWWYKQPSIDLTVAPAVKAAEDANGRIARAQTLAQRLLGEHAQVESPRLNVTGKFDSFTIRHLSIDDAKPGFRADVDATVQAKLGQRLQSQWDEEHDYVTYRSVPELPAFVPHPVAAPKPGYAIPFAVDANGHVVAWDLDSATPHAMVSGSTGGGKSVTVRTLLTSATRMGIEARICDPKMVSFLGFETWPNVTVLATDLDAITATILKTRADLHDRYVAIKNRQVTEDDLTPVILCVDECWEALATMNAAWRQSGEKGDSPGFIAFGEIARLGRQCRIHLLAAFQRPDAKIVGGEVRANFGTRILAGKGKIDTLRMLEFTKNVTVKVRGRAIVDVGDGELEAQIYWCPDPDRYAKLSPADRAIIDGLRPTAIAPVIPVTRPTAPVAHTPQPEPLAPILRPHFTIVENQPEPVDKAPAPPQTKRCTICQHNLPLTDFGADKHKTDGLNSRCRACDRKLVAARRAEKRKVSLGADEGP